MFFTPAILTSLVGWTKMTKWVNMQNTDLKAGSCFYFPPMAAGKINEMMRCLGTNSNTFLHLLKSYYLKVSNPDLVGVNLNEYK